VARNQFIFTTTTSWQEITNADATKFVLQIVSEADSAHTVLINFQATATPPAAGLQGFTLGRDTDLIVRTIADYSSTGKRVYVRSNRLPVTVIYSDDSL
jgi:hypothetical protein